MADLYVYFYELGCRHLKPGGRLSYIVTNKWMKAGYGEPLRKFFAESVWTESVVDFGHAKQIFEDADVFPCIVVIRKPTEEPQPKTVRVCAIPRETLRVDDLSQQIREEGFEIPIESLSSEAWRLELRGLNDLLEKVTANHSSLRTFANSKPQFGIKTGFNPAFLIDTRSKEQLVKLDHTCENHIRPYLRGQDVKRWKTAENGLWIILLKSSSNVDWPWSKASSESEAESLFQEALPSLHSHMKQHESRLRARSDQGRFWWELRSCAYYEEFDRRKIVWQDLSYHSRFAICDAGIVPEATCFSLSSEDLWIVSVLNSPMMWCWLWRRTIHGKDEVLRLKNIYTESIPIAEPTAKIRREVEQKASRMIEITCQQQATRRTLLDWFKVEYGIEKPSLKLQDPISLESDALVNEIKKLRGKQNPLSAAALKALRDEDARTLEPARRLQAEARSLENQLSDLVNAAYGLTPEEVKLMWDTAPPRMPIPRPVGV